MRICYLCPDLGVRVRGSKGASAHVRGFVRAMRSLGHDIRVMSPSAGGDAEVDVPLLQVPASETHAGLPPEPHARLTRALGHLWNNLSVEQMLKTTLAEWRPDLVYERYSPFGVAGGVVARSMGIPHVLEVNALLAEEGRLYRRQALAEACDYLEDVAFATTSLITVVSRELAVALEAKGIPASKVFYLPNGVDPDMFTPAGVGQGLGLEEKTVIGFVGNLRPWHGIEFLANAFRRLACDPSFHLLIVGDGPMVKLMHTLARELPGRVTLTGKVPHREIPAYVRAMDIAVAPYPKLERFYFSPLKVLEYMAAGRAIVATGVGQLRELIEDGLTGFLVEVDDASGFAEAIRRLAADRGLREAMGRRACEAARRMHSWQGRAQSLLDHIASAGLVRPEEEALAHE